MKKIIIFAHDFPPLTSIGAMRPESWFNNFIEFGLEPIIITRNWANNPNNYLDYYKLPENNVTSIEEYPNGTIIRAPFRPNLRDRLLVSGKLPLLRKFLTICNDFFKFRSFKGDSTREMYFEALKYAKNNKIDFIFATGDPWVNFRYAYKLSKKINVMWACDYRDGWNTDVSRQSQSKLLNFYKSITSGYYEKRIVNEAVFVSVSDPDVLERNKAFLKNNSSSFINPLNGYDSNKIDSIKNVKQSDLKLTIGYAGTIYDFQRIDMFLNGLYSFINEYKLTPNEITCNFFGLNYNVKQKDRVLNHNINLKPYINTTDRIPHNEVLENLLHSNLLLLLCSDEIVALPAKLFEYFGLERKILVVKNDRSVVEKFMNDTNAGFLCNTEDDVKKSLSEAYNEFRENKKVSSRIINKEFYSRKNQDKILASHILKFIK